MEKLIVSWKDLVGLESENYYLKINLDKTNGWIKPKEHYKKLNNEQYYLSTHTFYGDHYKASTLLLQKCGFNVQLKNCDE